MTRKTKNDFETEFFEEHLSAQLFFITPQGEETPQGVEQHDYYDGGAGSPVT